jgi:hypothetical protein
MTEKEVFFTSPRREATKSRASEKSAEQHDAYHSTQIESILRQWVYVSDILIFNTLDRALAANFYALEAGGTCLRTEYPFMHQFCGSDESSVC